MLEHSEFEPVNKSFHLLPGFKSSSDATNGLEVKVDVLLPPFLNHAIRLNSNSELSKL